MQPGLVVALAALLLADTRGATAQPVSEPRAAESALVGRFVGVGDPDTIATFHADGTGDWDAKGPTSGGWSYMVRVHFRWSIDPSSTLSIASASARSGPYGCAPSVVGRYAARVDDKTLSLALVDDTCAKRAFELLRTTARRVPATAGGG